jgi:hypothetical protein
MMRSSDPRRPTPGLLEHATADLRAAAGSGPYRLFVLGWLAAAAVIVARRGPSITEPLAVLAGALLVFGALAWMANRSPRVHSEPDPVRDPRREALAVGIAVVGATAWAFGAIVPGMVLVVAGVIGWLVVVVAARPPASDARWLSRSWLPFIPLLAVIALPKALTIGVGLVPQTLIAIPSGILQQVLLQVGMTARTEAIVGRRDLAAVVAALGFGLVHIPLNLPQAEGDWLVAAANAMVLQAGIGLVACGAYLRHRAPLPLGTAHAMLMA